LLTSSAFTIQFYKSLTNQVAGATKTIDNNPETIKKLREKAEQDRLLEEAQQQKANNEALKRINEMKLMEQTKLAVDNVKYMEKNDDAYKKLTNNLILSESAKSRDHRVNLVDGTPEMYAKQLEMQRANQIMLQQRELEKMNEMLDRTEKNNDNASMMSSISVNKDAKKIIEKKKKNDKDKESSLSSTSKKSKNSKISINGHSGIINL
jgi:hypothetical protein